VCKDTELRSCKDWNASTVSAPVIASPSQKCGNHERNLKRWGGSKWRNIHSFNLVPVLHTSFHISSFQWHIPQRVQSPQVNNRKKNTRKKQKENRLQLWKVFPWVYIILTAELWTWVLNDFTSVLRSISWRYVGNILIGWRFFRLYGNATTCSAVHQQVQSCTCAIKL
jgi:hypothetical protein